MRNGDHFFRVSTILLGKAATVTIGMAIKGLASGSNGTLAGLGAACPGDRGVTYNFRRTGHLGRMGPIGDPVVQLKAISAISIETRSGSSTWLPLASRA
jgi:hypothetical protein